jgi:hypothetical protein
MNTLLFLFIWDPVWFYLFTLSRTVCVYGAAKFWNLYRVFQSLTSFKIQTSYYANFCVFLWISERTETIFLYTINWQSFIRRRLFTARYGRKSFVASAELGKATIIFVTPISLSVSMSSWKNSDLTRRIIIKFEIWVFFEYLSRKFQNLLKSDKNKPYFTWRPMYIYNNISLNSS